MRKPTQAGTCAICPTEIFSWHPTPGGGGRRLLANAEFREVAFRVVSSLPIYNGSMMRAAFCSEDADAITDKSFAEITENIRDGVKLDATRMSFKDEAAKFLHLGSFLSREIAAFCSCKPDDAVVNHRTDKCEGKKTLRRCCQHCYQICDVGPDHDAVCEILQRDLKT